MHFDIGDHTIFLGVTGSHAYGMARPESDIDIKGCCIAPMEMRLSPYKTFAQYQCSHAKPDLGVLWKDLENGLTEHATAASYFRETGGTDIDCTVFEIAKLVKLCSDANPNMLELLFLHPDDILLELPEWKRLREHRDLFLSKKVKHTYTGYANSQLKRIKGHRSWLLDPPQREPLRADFGLPEESVLPADVRNLIDENITTKIRMWGVEDGLDDYIKGAPQDLLRERMHEFWQGAISLAGLNLTDDIDETVYQMAAAQLGMTRETLAAIKQERAYRQARKHWQQFKRWERERNPKRATLEAEFGYDTKHASHLIRLLRTGLEILRGEGLLVKRADAKELLDIRAGHHSYDDLIEAADKLESDINIAYEESSLPKKPQIDEIETVLIDILLDR